MSLMLIKYCKHLHFCSQFFKTLLLIFINRFFLNLFDNFETRQISESLLVPKETFLSFLNLAFFVNNERIYHHGLKLLFHYFQYSQLFHPWHLQFLSNF